MIKIYKARCPFCFNILKTKYETLRHTTYCSTGCYCLSLGDLFGPSEFFTLDKLIISNHIKWEFSIVRNYCIIQSSHHYHNIKISNYVFDGSEKSLQAIQLLGF